MKLLSYFSVGFTIVGAFIGAGFVSGQELWQFFGRFGYYGFIGLLIAVIFISLLSYTIIKNAIKSGANSFETLIVQNQSPIAKKMLITLETVFYFCLYVIMTAGAGSLSNESFGFNKITSAVVFAIIVTIISIMGVKWIISVFSATVPILTFSVLIIAIILGFRNQIVIPPTKETDLFPAILSSIIFVSYNFIAGIGVFASLSRQIKSKKRLAISSAIACLFLFLLGLAILVSIFFCPGSETADLPMINVVTSLNKSLGAIYSILLILAMLGASLASVFPIAEMLKKSRKKQIICTSVISAVCVGLSSIGFKELIGTIYPIFGYIGFVVIALIIFNNIKREAK